MELKVGIRGKGKIQNCLNLNHVYDYYIKDLDKDSKYNIDKTLFRNICKEYNELLSDLIVNEGYFFKVPYRLGLIRIKKKQTSVNLNTLKPDYGLYRESGGRYKNRHLNEHSGGYYVRYYWSKSDALVINKTAYSFIPTRANKRKLSSIVKERGMLQVNKYFD